MEKRGQFFLIAALVIVAIIFSLGVIYISTKTVKEDITVLDLSKEISYEGSQVIDNGVYTGGDIDQRITELVGYYSEKNQDSDIMIVYGSSEGVKILEYLRTAHSVGISTGGPPSSIQVRQRVLEGMSRIPVGDKIEVPFGESTYEFDLKEGQNFYIIIKKEKGAETIVAQE